jgi:aromatic ring-cleaving dioxygenase
MLSKTTMDRPPVAQFRAHVYYDPATARSRGERLRKRVAGAFPQAKLGRWHDELVAPHPQSMFQIAFPAEIFGAFVPWLMLNRDGLAVLVHPETGDDLTDPQHACRVVGRAIAAAAWRVRKAKMTTAVRV